MNGSVMIVVCNEHGLSGTCSAMNVSLTNVVSNERGL